MVLGDRNPERPQTSQDEVPLCSLSPAVRISQKPREAVSAPALQTRAAWLTTDATQTPPRHLAPSSLLRRVI